MGTLNVTTTDNNMSAAAAAASSLASILVIGTSSLGTQNTVIPIYSPDDAKTLLGNGPLADYAAFIVRYAGGPVYCINATASTLARNTAVAHAGTATIPTFSIAGTALNKYYVVIKCVTAGTRATAKYQISFDGGVTYSGVRDFADAATIALVDNGGRSTGITLTVGSGTYVTDHVWTFKVYPACQTAGNLTTAMTAALASPYVWSMALLASSNDSTDAVDVNCIAAAKLLAAQMETEIATNATAALRFATGFVCAPEPTPSTSAAPIDQNTTFNTALLAAGGFSAAYTRVGVSGSYVQATNAITNDQSSFPWAVPYLAQMLKCYKTVGPQWDISCPGTDKNEVGRGALSAISRSMYDERSGTPKLAGTMLVPTTVLLKTVTNYYPASSAMMTANGSDFSRLQRRLVMDLLTSLVTAYFTDYLSAVVAVNSNGTIQEEQAKNIEAGCVGQIVDTMVLPKYLTPPTTDVPLVVIDRNWNVLTSNKMKVRVRAIPWGYSDTIDINMAYYAPNTATAL